MRATGYAWMLVVDADEFHGSRSVGLLKVQEHAAGAAGAAFAASASAPMRVFYGSQSHSQEFPRSLRETDLKRYDSVPRAVYVVQRRGDSIDGSHKTRERRCKSLSKRSSCAHADLNIVAAGLKAVILHRCDSQVDGQLLQKSPPQDCTLLHSAAHCKRTAAKRTAGTPPQR